VHDLRTVFPSIPIVALTDDPQKLARAVAAGATIALPRSTPLDQLAKVVRRLISH
jgi:DNA-binding NarL/FixJ family response regulator